MDLTSNPPKVESFFLPCHQPTHNLSMMWSDKNKVGTNEMQQNLSNIEEHISCQYEKAAEESYQSEFNRDVRKVDMEILEESHLEFQTNKIGITEDVTDDIQRSAGTQASTDPVTTECNRSEIKEASQLTEHTMICFSPKKLSNDKSVMKISEKSAMNETETTTESRNHEDEAREVVKDEDVRESSCKYKPNDKDVTPRIVQTEQKSEERIGMKDCTSDVTSDSSMLEDNLDTFDLVLSEDIATMLYDNVDKVENKEAVHLPEPSKTPGSSLTKNESESNIVSAGSNKGAEGADVSAPGTCKICGGAARLGVRFCSRKCLGKNAAMSRKSSFSGSKHAKKSKKKFRDRQDLKYSRDDTNNLAVVQDTVQDGKNNLKIKIRWSKSTDGTLNHLGSNTHARRICSTGSSHAGGGVKKKFHWIPYLQEEDAIAAPPEAFEQVTGENPIPSCNPFQINMTMEGVDPKHESLISALVVKEIRGCRIRLRFCGYVENYDFWINVDSELIFPCGFCKETERTLQPPQGYSLESFSWEKYNNNNGLYAAPRSCFASFNYANEVLFKAGQKLEAADKHNTNLVYAATVQDVIFRQLLIHFDGQNHDCDYWCSSTSQYIHPVGWCQQNDKTLTHQEVKDFSWAEYLVSTKSQVVDEKAFTVKSSHMFKTGMKLEVVDPRNKILVRVATIIEMEDFQVKIHFDGWSDMYDFWTHLENPNIHPCWWCEKTKHPLQAPISHDELEFSGGSCPIPGCEGIGHVTGRFTNHYSEFGCPYSPQNFEKEHVKDRLLQHKSQRSIASVLTTHMRDRKQSPCTEEYDDPDYCIPNKLSKYERSLHTHPTVRTRKHYSSSAMTFPPLKKMSEMRSFFREDDFETNGFPTATARAASTWSIAKVAKFIKSVTNTPLHTKMFAREEIDGVALLMLTQLDILRIPNIKLSDVMKIHGAITKIKDAR